MHAAASAVPSQARAVLFAMISVATGAGMDVLGKIATDAAGAWQIMFMRWAFGVVLIVVICLLVDRPGLWSGDRRAHLWRFGLNIGAGFSLYYALGRLPLSIVLTMFFLEPLFMLVVARIVLGEMISRRRWLGCLVGFSGVLLIAAPGLGAGFGGAPLDLTALGACLFGAAAWGSLHIATKKYGGGCTTTSLMFWIAVLSAIASAPFAAANWAPLDLTDHAVFAGVAVFGLAHGWFWITALKMAPASLMAGIAYLTLPIGYGAGFLLFGETPTAIAVLGSLVIMVAVYVATRDRAVMPASHAAE